MLISPTWLLLIVCLLLAASRVGISVFHSAEAPSFIEDVCGSKVPMQELARGTFRSDNVTSSASLSAESIDSPGEIVGKSEEIIVLVFVRGENAESPTAVLRIKGVRRISSAVSLLSGSRTNISLKNAVTSGEGLGNA